MSALYFTCNRGKRSIALDLHQPEGVEIALRLAAESDVIVENYRPGVMEKLGLGYDAVRAVQPRHRLRVAHRIRVRGPVRDRSAYDTVIQAYGGFAINQADPTADGMPVFLRQTAADKVTALYASQAITAALFAAGERRRWPAPRAVDDRRGGVVPVGRRRRQRGAARVRRLA